MFKSSVNTECMVQKERKADSVEEKWLAFKNAVLRCTRSACGVKLLNKCGIRTGCEWWNAEVERLMKAKKWEYQKWLQSRTREANARYKCARNEVKIALIQVKRRQM